MLAGTPYYENNFIGISGGLLNIAHFVCFAFYFVLAHFQISIQHYLYTHAKSTCECLLA
jgi:hypothetical protein